MRLWGVAPGRRAVVATANAHGYAAALDLLDAGVAVAAVLDLRPEMPALVPPPSCAGRGVACATAGRRGGARQTASQRRAPR